MGGAAGEPSSPEEGGQGGVDSVDPLEWKLELQLVEPTPHQLELARAAAGDPASSGLIAVSEDGARVLGDANFPDRDASGRSVHFTELIFWTEDFGSVSLGRLPGLEPPRITGCWLAGLACYLES